MIANLQAEKAVTTQPRRKRRRRKVETDGIRGFAERYRLKIRTDPGDDTAIIAGQLGHLYQADDGLLGVMVMPGISRKQHWTRSRTKFLEAGFSILQDGDHEGSASFSPDNLAQAKLAIKVAGARRKRTASRAQREQLVKARQTLRRGQFSTLETTRTPPDSPQHGESVLEPQTANYEHGRWSGCNEIIVAKQREGLVGSEPVLLDAHRLWFVPRTGKQ